MSGNTDPYYRLMGRVIQKFRKAARMKQHELAADLKTTRGHIALMETGQQRIAAHFLADIEHFVGVEPGTIMAETRKLEAQDHGEQQDRLDESHLQPVVGMREGEPRMQKLLRREVCDGAATDASVGAGCGAEDCVGSTVA